MNLHDRMQQAVEHADPDLDRLGRVARVQGTRLRRRRQGLVLLGAAAVVSAVALGAGVLQAQDVVQRPGAGVPQIASDPVSASPTAEPSLDLSIEGPASGRGVTAALRHAISSVEDGSASQFAGQGGSGRGDDFYGELAWTDDGPGVSVVGVNVQPGMDFASTCTSYVVNCTSEAQAGGGRLTTYEERTPVAAGVGVRWVADLLRADGTRVVASSTNGYDLPSNRWDVTRPLPALTFAQLTQIIRQPWWGGELPQYFLDRGEELDGYQDFGALDAEASIAPTPSR